MGLSAVCTSIIVGANYSVRYKRISAIFLEIGGVNDDGFDHI